MASRNGPSSAKRHVVGRICLCSPTTHPGSFRCSVHRNPHKSRASSTTRLSSRNLELAAYVSRSNWMRALLFQIIKPSSHDLHRRRNFKPRPSRFRLMNIE